LLPATQQLTKTPPHTVGFLRFRSPITPSIRNTPTQRLPHRSTR